MAGKKKTAAKKPSGKKAEAPKEEPTPTPDLEENIEAEEKKADAPKANETPKKGGAKVRVWYAEPLEAATLKTSRGTLVKGRPISVPEGSEAHEFYKRRSDVRMTAMPSKE